MSNLPVTHAIMGAKTAAVATPTARPKTSWKATSDVATLASATLAGLSAQNRYALAFRLHNLKTAAARTRKIGEFVTMLREGKTIYPQGRKKT